MNNIALASIKPNTTWICKEIDRNLIVVENLVLVALHLTKKEEQTHTETTKA